MAHGFTHVEFLPVMEHPFGGSWGYQVSAYYAPTARFGTLTTSAWSTDCTQAGVGVLVDRVPAHFPKDDFALARFDGTLLYEHADPLRGEHPDWGTYVFDFDARRCATSWSPTPCTGARSSTSTACGSTLWPPCCAWTTPAKKDNGRPTPTEAGRTSMRAVHPGDECHGLQARGPGFCVAEESTAWPG